MKRFPKYSFALLIVCSLLFFCFHSKVMAVSVLFGGFFSLLNFWLLSFNVKLLLGISPAGARAFHFFFVLLKYPILLGILGFAVLKTHVNLVAAVFSFVGFVILVSFEMLRSESCTDLTGLP